MSDLEVKQAVYYILIVYIRVQCTMVLVGYFGPKRKHVVIAHMLCLGIFGFRVQTESSKTSSVFANSKWRKLFSSASALICLLQRQYKKYGQPGCLGMNVHDLEHVDWSSLSDYDR